ncbi:MAG: DsbA family protein [Pseudomonadota bacterium]
MRETYFFSFRSPYSWLASLRLKDRIEAGDGLELVPFFEPDPIRKAALEARGGTFPYTPMSDAKHRYILRDVKRLTTAAGLTHVWPVDPAPWWEASHLGYLQAEEMGYGLPFFWQVYRARWELGLDISKPDSIAQICRNAGMSRAEAQKVCDAPDDEEISAKGVDALYRVFMGDVFGVPMLVRKRNQYWGIDRLDAFLADAPMPTAPRALIAEAGVLEFDHTGGCG